MISATRTAIPAITIWQPFASLIAFGEKTYETRAWKTTYRGPLAIHAALGTPSTRNRLPLGRDVWDALERHSVMLGQLPTGAIVCEVELLDCELTGAIVPWISEKEKAFGDYGAGRYAWRLKVTSVYKPPVPARGRQGIWEWKIQP